MLLWERQKELGLDTRCTSSYVENMPKMVQIRHVPDEVHRKLKERAAMAGMSLSAYLRREVELIAERPTIREIEERLASLPPVNPSVSPAEVIRAERDSR